jgi:hypothetical protein
MAIKLEVPIYSYRDLRRKADEFLAKFNPTGVIPVPIEEIAEFSLGLNIIPIPGLQDALEVDGFIASDFRSITVDQFVIERREWRYRFTLAHELGHLWLHQKIFEKLTFRTIEDWKSFQQNVDAENYGWLEYQAYAFGGLVLVPRKPLASHRATCEQAVKSEGLDPKTEAAQWYVCEMLTNVFNVSRSVIEKRLAKDDKEN